MLQNIGYNIMYITYLKQGFGNKMMMLLSSIKQFLKEKGDILYVFPVESKHDSNSEKEYIENIFPKLKELKWLKFVHSWKDFDTLKKQEHIEIKNDYDFTSEIFQGMKTFIKKYLVVNPEYKHLLKKYDTKNGMLLHYRLGDKLNLSNKYLVMKPEYFKKHIKSFNGPVYMVSDSPKIAKTLIPEAEILDTDWVETFYLMTKFRNAVLSESTFGVVASYLNQENHKFIFPAYHVEISTGKLIDFSWGPVFEYETDRSYRYVKK
jgi:hypothetical protein